jgi:hypothetical protein
MRMSEPCFLCDRSLSCAYSPSCILRTAPSRAFHVCFFSHTRTAHSHTQHSTHTHRERAQPGHNRNVRNVYFQEYFCTQKKFHQNDMLKYHFCCSFFTLFACAFPNFVRRGTPQFVTDCADCDHYHCHGIIIMPISMLFPSVMHYTLCTLHYIHTLSCTIPLCVLYCVTQMRSCTANFDQPVSRICAQIIESQVTITGHTSQVTVTVTVTVCILEPQTASRTQVTVMVMVTVTFTDTVKVTVCILEPQTAFRNTMCTYFIF